MKNSFKLWLTVFVLTVSLVLCLVSCGGGETDVPDGTESTPETTVNTPETTPEETEPETVGETVPAETLFEIVEKPANATFEKVFKSPGGDKRQIVLDYMLKMAKIEWTPAVDFTCTSAPGVDRDFSINLNYKAGKTYYGVIYGNTKATFDEFSDCLNGNVFTCDSYYYDNIVGNHCSSSMFLAYQHIIPVEYGTLRPSTARTGIFKLAGELENPGEGTWYSQDVFDLNGQDAVFEAFATLDKGDILFKCIPGSGHTRMVSKPAEIAKSATGKLLPARSIIYVIENTNAWYDSNENTTWWVDKKYTFQKLWDTGFMPITVCSYFDDSEVTDAYIWFNGKNSPDQIVDKLVGTVSSNYPLGYVTVLIEDANGNVVRKLHKNNISKISEVNLTREHYELKLNELPAGTYKYTLKAGIARGACEIESFNFTVN